MDVVRIRIRQRHHKRGDLRQFTIKPDVCEAEVDLCLARMMRQRQKDFPVPLLQGSDRILDDRLATVVAVLVSQPLEDPLGRVPLLAMHLPITFENLLDDRQERLRAGWDESVLDDIYAGFSAI